MRLNRQQVTVEHLIQTDQSESDEVAGLSHKGKISLIHQFMTLFDLSIREITGTEGFRAKEEEIEARETFLSKFKQTITVSLRSSVSVRWTRTLKNTPKVQENEESEI